jgi:hypothetical protein
MRATATEALLGLPTLHLQLEAEATAGIIHFTAVINKTPILKDMDMHTCLRA